MVSESINTTIGQPLTTPWDERVSCVIVFSIFSVLGVLTNGMAICLPIFSEELRKNKVNFFISNLAMGDFLMSFVFLFGENVYILYRDSMSPVGCQWVGFLHFISAMQQFIFPPFLAINRFICLYHNTAYQRIYTSSNMILMAIGSWVISTSIPLVYTMTGHTGYDMRNEHCCLTVANSPAWKIAYWIVILGPLLCVCDSTMVYCNLKIYSKMRHHGKSNGQDVQHNVINENKELMYFMIIDTLVPICANTCYHLANLLIPVRVSLVSRQLFTCLLLVASAIRGTIILVMLRPYRRAFKVLILRTNQIVVYPIGSSVAMGTISRMH